MHTSLYAWFDEVGEIGSLIADQPKLIELCPHFGNWTKKVEMSAKSSILCWLVYAYGWYIIALPTAAIVFSWSPFTITLFENKVAGDRSLFFPSTGILFLWAKNTSKTAVLVMEKQPWFNKFNRNRSSMPTRCFRAGTGIGNGFSRSLRPRRWSGSQRWRMWGVHCFRRSSVTVPDQFRRCSVIRPPKCCGRLCASVYPCWIRSVNLPKRTMVRPLERDK